MIGKYNYGTGRRKNAVARVFIKPGKGDIARTNMRDRPDADSLFFLSFNGNKRSLTLNLKSAGGKQVFAKLLEKGDVLLENFGPGVLERLGFGWETLRTRYPRLVYATIKGFGSYGPNADFKSYEPVAQAMGSAMSVTGFPDGPPTYIWAFATVTNNGTQQVTAITPSR